MAVLPTTLFPYKSWAQHSYMAADNVAVFYPPKYDVSAHAPSPIFVRELAPQGDIAAVWKLRPIFGRRDSLSTATIHVGSDVDLYGGGEVYGDLRRNGKTISMWNVDTPAYSVDGGTHLYQSHPWVMGLRRDGSAFGIIADNTWRMTMHTGDDVVFESQGPAFRVVVIEDKSPEALMQTFSNLVGRMEMPPLWALGYHQCRFSYHPDSRVREVADTLRNLKIPCDVIWLDINYMDKFKIFTFDPVEFPDPKGLTDYLHAHDFKCVSMIDPGVKVEAGYPIDDQGCAADYWVLDKDGKPFVGNVWPGACHFPDFTRGEVRRWWSGLYPPFMRDNGIDGIWNDMNEPAVFGGKESTMPIDNLHRGGEGLAAGPHLRYHNVYGYHMVHASRDGLLQAHPNRRPFVLSRANFLGGHRYAATWTGDNLSSVEQMKVSVPMSITLGLSGQPFNGPDIGGFCENATAELLADWTAIGVYFPFVRNHCIDNARAQEPWAFDEQTLDVCRTAINRRYRLLPYIYTAFREAATTGMPVMRPAFMADNRDERLRAEQEAFMLGGDLMIVPRWATNQCPVEGWQPMKFDNEQNDKYQPTVLQRPGSIVPLAPLCQSTATYSTDSLTLMLCLDADGQAHGTMYEDDGDGFGYRKGDFALYEMRAARTRDSITLTMARSDGNRAERPRQVRLAISNAGRTYYSSWMSAEGVMSIRLPKKFRR